MIAHLVGSVPLADAEAVFRTLMAGLGPHLKRLPDGETGRRADWIGFIRRHMGRHPAFEKDETRAPYQFKQWDGRVVMEWPFLRFKAGASRDIQFTTGYADDAIRSHSQLAELQNDGTIPHALRFQVCFAPPHAIALMYISPEDRADFVRAYTRHLAVEIARIAAAVPPERLAIQWDVCQEVLWWEGYFPRTDTTEREILESLTTLGAAVPARAELGYHLCYGSPLDAPCLIPRNMGVLVAMANGIARGARRRVDYIHLPVTQGRRDRTFFEPLAELQLAPETELHLGCVQPDDDAGNLERLRRAEAHVPIHGIGSECGWGRGEPARLAPMIAAHRRLLGDEG